tara:strand:- start:41020 stop:42267 length:1248 start_codon:yes stop_codon:yes gene_type:complete
MGGMCTTQVGGNITLPASGKTLTGTDIPEWVSEAGKRLFAQATGLAGSPFPQYKGARIAEYGDSKLTPEELRGQQMLGTDYGSSYLEESAEKARQLGQGFGASTREQLLGLPPPQLYVTPMESGSPPPPMQPVIGTPVEQDPMIPPMQPVIGTPIDRPTGPTRTDYTGATRSDLLGDADLSQYMQTFQSAVDPAVAEAERQFEMQSRLDAAEAAKRGAFGGSRAEIQRVLGTSELARRTGDIRKQAGREALEFGASQAERDRTARFAAENLLRGQYDKDVANRMAAEDAVRAGYETEEASRLRSQQAIQDLGPLMQSLKQEQAMGLISSGEARRRLDQAALDLAYADYLEQRQFPREMINYALGVLKGVPYEQTQYSLTKGVTTQPGATSPSVYGQTIGGLGSLASAYFMGRGRG